MEQSGRILAMRVKLDVWTQGAPEPWREKCRQTLEDMYFCLPAVRVSLYAKRVRHILLNPSEATGPELDLESDIFAKAEDAVAAGSS